MMQQRITDRLIILSDIHGNLTALEAVIADFEARGYLPQALAILGDNINYGMRPNEVVARLKKLARKYPVAVNIFGNHEKALFDGDDSRFSTDRGRQVLEYTRRSLTAESCEYLQSLTHEGSVECVTSSGARVLFIHGSPADPFWGKLGRSTAVGEEYARYDFVLSGHSHIPHLIEHFFAAEAPEFRNKKRTIFLNPGSVGQPRNHNPRAQYLYADFASETFHFNSVEYDVAAEQALFTPEVDPFYSRRLTNGI